MSGQNSFRIIQLLLATDELPSLGPEMRSTPESIPALEKKLRDIFSEIAVPELTQQLVRSLVLLWHDYLDESHSISQDIHSVDGSFLHGIMHRREPDYGNAKYWFHKVREHPCYPVIATRVGELLDDAKTANLKAKIIHAGDWDAFAFVDACESALLKNDATTVVLLKQVQEIEFKTLLEHFLGEPLSPTQ